MNNSNSLDIFVGYSVESTESTFALGIWQPCPWRKLCTPWNINRVRMIQGDSFQWRIFPTCSVFGVMHVSHNILSLFGGLTSLDFSNQKSLTVSIKSSGSVPFVGAPSNWVSGVALGNSSFSSWVGGTVSTGCSSKGSTGCAISGVRDGTSSTESTTTVGIAGAGTAPPGPTTSETSAVGFAGAKRAACAAFLALSWSRRA